MVVFDIGGTFIKYALTAENGELLTDTVRQTPSHADDDYDAFLGAMEGILREAGERQKVRKACVSIAGPFDFERGISLMRHKFRSLYQKSLRRPFEQAGVDVMFLHDSTAFMLGEAYDGVLQGRNAPCCVMLGTGLGFAFMRDGKVCVNPQRGPAFTLWNAPWRDGTAEDYVSTRAIQGLYGETLPIREIAERARQGDRKAGDPFLETGRQLSAILREIIPRLRCDSFALGGQIAKSADLLGLEVPVEWQVSRHLDDAALRGASRFARYGREDCEQDPGKLF